MSLQRMIRKDIKKMIENIYSGMPWNQALIKTKFFKTYAFLKYKGKEEDFKVRMANIQWETRHNGVCATLEKFDSYFVDDVFKELPEEIEPVVKEQEENESY